jgi:hypothetical protein
MFYSSVGLNFDAIVFKILHITGKPIKELMTNGCRIATINVGMKTEASFIEAIPILAIFEKCGKRRYSVLPKTRMSNDLQPTAPQN